MAVLGGWWSKQQIEYGVQMNAENVDQRNAIEEETEEDEGDHSDGDRSDDSDKGEDPDYVVAEDNWLYNVAVDMDMNDYRENVDSDGEYSDEDSIQEDGIDHEDMDLQMNLLPRFASVQETRIHVAASQEHCNFDLAYDFELVEVDSEDDISGFWFGSKQRRHQCQIRVFNKLMFY
ncbi:hypothetical protein R6Q57_022658 [Mikania cordata]